MNKSNKTLLQILVEKRSVWGDWPERGDAVVQDGDSKIMFYSLSRGERPSLKGYYWESGSDCSDTAFIGPGWPYLHELAFDYQTAHVTREQYEAALSNVRLKTADESGLLPCPFCGSKAEVVDDRLRFYVECQNDDCGVVVIGERVPELQSEQEAESINWEAVKQTAIDKWNRRSV